MPLLRVCRHCKSRNITLIAEGGHSRAYYCSDCNKQSIQFLKKKIRCRHEMRNGMCEKCGYDDKKYT